MLRLIFLIPLLPWMAHASGALTSYTYLYDGKTVTAQIGETEGVLVNDICLKQGARCAALAAFHSAARVNELHGVKGGNFSGAYCELLSGTQLFLEAARQKSAAQFCVFADLSMIDAKALYRRHLAAGAKRGDE